MTLDLRRIIVRSWKDPAKKELIKNVLNTSKELKTLLTQSQARVSWQACSSDPTNLAIEKDSDPENASALVIDFNNTNNAKECVDILRSAFTQSDTTNDIDIRWTCIPAA